MTTKYKLPTAPNYEAIERKMWRSNAKEVVPNLDHEDEYLYRKIKSYAWQFGYEASTIEEKIRNDEMFAATFATVPSRQGIHEKIAKEWLEKKLDVEVEILPKSGKKALFVNSDGMILQIPKKEAKSSKSLDFRWYYKNVTFYAMHKYTRDSGGGQGNTYNELVRLLKNFQSAKNPDNVLIIIADGSFYTDEKMTELNNYTRTNSPKSYAVHIEEVPKIMEQYR